MIKLKTNLKAACCAQAAATVLSKRLCSVGLGYRPSHGASARQSDSVAATVTVPVAAAAVTVTVTRAGQLPPPTLPCGNSSGLRPSESEFVALAAAATRRRAGLGLQASFT